LKDKIAHTASATCPPNTKSRRLEYARKSCRILIELNVRHLTRLYRVIYSSGFRDWNINN
jgi:hypothetical protein